MKFSVLLPTRNRLEYLKYAIESVVQQNYDNWELIISDNCSDEDIASYVQSLKNSKIKYYRTNFVCSVTENWNNALEKSTGDYLVMLGDDDCLLKDYFKICMSLIKQHDFPDLIYNSALQYTYPNVIPESPKGSLIKCGYAPFLIENSSPVILDKKESLTFAKKMMSFNVIVNFNAQHSLVSRSLVNELQKYGKFYQSPYPDYYSTTAMFVKAKRILAVPYRLVVIGISPKSFGYFYCNKKEKEGVEFLRNDSMDAVYHRVKKFLMPGTEMLTSWLLAMEAVRINFNKEFSLRVNYKKYRLLQVLQNYKKFACLEGEGIVDLLKMARSLFWWEKIFYLIPFFRALLLRQMSDRRSAKTLANSMAYKLCHPDLGASQVVAGQYENIFDVFQQIDPSSAEKITA